MIGPKPPWRKVANDDGKVQAWTLHQRGWIVVNVQDNPVPGGDPAFKWNAFSGPRFVKGFHLGANAKNWVEDEIKAVDAKQPSEHDLNEAWGV